MVVLEQMVIEGFRGFSKRVIFEFGSHATILGGANGTGKTSVFDALEWAVLGAVERLGGTRDFVLAGNVERNVFSSAKIETSVTAVFVTDEGKLEFFKSANVHRARLAGQAVKITEAYRLLGIDPQDPVGAFLRVHLLEQDRIGKFVDQKPRDRYEALKSLSSLLETEQIDKNLLETLDGAIQGARFESEALERLLGREIALLQQNRSDISHLESRLVQASEFTVEQLVEEEAALLAQIVAGGILGLESETRVDASLGALLRRQDEVKASRDFLISFQSSFQGTQTLRERTEKAEDAARVAQQELDDLMQQLQELRTDREHVVVELRQLDSRVQEAQRQHSDLQSLLQGVLRHITTNTCPVCQREIDIQKLKQIVYSQIEASPLMPSDLVQQRNDLEETLKKMGADEIALADSERQTNSKHRERVSELRILQQELSKLELGERKATEIVGKTDFSPSDLQSALERSSRQLEEIQQWVEKLNLLQSRKVLMNERSLLTDKRRDKERMESTVASLKKKSERLQNGIARLTNTRESARRAQVELTSRVLKTYEPLAAELYNRLRPHRVFQKFEMAVIPAYKEGELFLHAKSEEGISIHIPAVFSMTQRNAVALCFFLALNLSLGSDRKIALIDDPINSMDDINVLGLADLFQQLKGTRQLMFSTHDRTLFDLFLDKLGRDSEKGGVVGYWFDSWGRSGPRITHELPPVRGKILGIDEIAKLLPVA